MVIRETPRCAANRREDGIFSPAAQRPETIASATICWICCCIVASLPGGSRKISGGIGILGGLPTGRDGQGDRAPHVPGSIRRPAPEARLSPPRGAARRRWPR